MRLTLLFLLIAITSNNSYAKRHYVNIGATGLNNGTSWGNAFTDLSTAIDNNTGNNDTFWVAQGTYTSHTLEAWAFHVLVNNTLFGGFEGTETALSQRNHLTHKTILSGSNAYPGSTMLVAAYGGRVDGFTITHNGPKFGQTANYGIQVQLQGSGRFVFENCEITNFWCFYPVRAEADTAGGTIDFINCQFIGNGVRSGSAAANYGSAIYCGGKKAKFNITNCLFKNNEGQKGGAIQQRDSSQVTVNRSIFYGNLASEAGGAIFDSISGKLRVFNSLIVGNKAPTGGAHYAADSLKGSHNFSHCTISGNWGSKPGLTVNYALWLRRPTDTLRNCIAWGDSTGTFPEVPSPKPGAVFDRNVIKGGGSFTASTNTYTFNPLFVSPGNASAAPFAATSTYNYHLSALSDAVDTGANLGLTGIFARDLDSNVRVQGPWPDLGAYEWKVCPWNNVTITASGPTTFCLPGSVMLTAAGNPAYNHVYQWNQGSFTGKTITVTTNGPNKVVVVDSLGCRSSAGLFVNAVAAPSPTITKAGNTLSVPAIFATYQWYLGATPVAGATSASFNPTSNGNYTVKVTTVIGGCQGTSVAYNLTNLSAGSVNAEATAQVYPNPSSGRFTVTATGPAAEVNLTVTSITGQQVFLQQYAHTGNVFSKEIDLGDAAKGLYFVKIEMGGRVSTLKLLIN